MVTVNAYVPLDPFSYNPDNIFADLNSVYYNRTSHQEAVSAEFNGVVYDSVYIAFSGPDNINSQYYYGSNIVVDQYGNILSGQIYAVARYVLDGETYRLNYSVIFDPIETTTFLSYSYQSFLSSGAFSGNDFIYGGDGNDFITGEAGDDYLSGGAGNDTFSYASRVFIGQPGSGEAGNETMVGGLGDDKYYINGGDQIIENFDEGTDTVHSTISYTLTENVENLILFDAYYNTQGDLNGTGNSLDNILTGSDGANILDGGTGADTLIGGFGNDTYITDGNDTIVEELYGSTDTVKSSVSYTLADGLENLTLVGLSAIDATGNNERNILIGNDAANVLTGSGGDTLIGGKGDDTYVIDNDQGIYFEITENLNSGVDTVVTSSLYYYELGQNIENLVLTGSATNVFGNFLNNRLTGNAAENYLDGRGGDDVLIGGLGSDTYLIDGGDTIIEKPNEGTDLVLSYVSSTLAANLENLDLMDIDRDDNRDMAFFNKTYAAINATGNNLDNVLRGTQGANTLFGGTGIDTLVGRAGDDIYITDGNDIVIENGFKIGPDGIFADIDTVRSSGTYTMASNLDIMVLTGIAAINGTGNTLNNAITGNAAANTLNGATGADRLSGGLGNDTYITDGGDTITEALTAGTDTVRSSVSYTLGVNVENLVLTASAAINGTGNTLNNVITGNAAANTLNGGTGNDRLVGGVGNDIYVVNGGDTIVEAAAAGTDTVQSTVAYTLGLNLENLTLSGSGAINGSGNTLNNVITGNGAANTLNGGTGNDRIIGGLGNDTYITDGGDTITEALSAGTDTVRSSVSYTLGANLENLILTGSAAINGTGNTLNNAITGNAAANTLNGGTGNDRITGGLGKDTLVGGVGADTFVFNTITDSTTVATTWDIITDFTRGQDKIDLRSIDAFGPSAANDAFLWKGAAAFSSASAGEARFQRYDNAGTANDYTVVFLDNDADTAVEMAIRLHGLHNLAATDFMV